MRGIHDGAMPGGGTEREKAARQLAIIADQREMLARLVTSNLAAVPQIFCPYKEVLPIYDGGLHVPDDVTIMWVDDNFGYIRRLSRPEERRTCTYWDRRRKEATFRRSFSFPASAFKQA